MNLTLPLCEWVYFATPSRASWTVTAEFVTEAKTIIRNIYNSDGLRIANVANLEPGDKILLAYGGSGRPYRPLFAATIARAAIPVRGPKHCFDVFTYIDGVAIGPAAGIRLHTRPGHWEVRRDRDRGHARSPASVLHDSAACRE